MDLPSVIAFAEDHAAFKVEGSAHVRERLSAACTFETPVMPISI